MCAATAGPGFVDLDPDPFRQLEEWLLDARRSTLREPSAMALATVGPEGDPQVRMVLLRGLDERGGLTFYSNYESEKGVALARHPRAALCLYWDSLERQVRVTGDVERLDRQVSAAYFAARPLGSRIAAWASAQSRPIADRVALETRYREAAERFATDDVPLPAQWGGYRVIPTSFEFWQGRADRLHDRLRYTRAADGGWQRQRLMP